jgi:DNA-directed RNA polymerase subunit RPC12/RpoP
MDDESLICPECGGSMFFDYESMRIGFGHSSSVVYYKCIECWDSFPVWKFGDVHNAPFDIVYS